MSYCGCATRANKIKWGLFAGFLLAFIVCLVAYVFSFVRATNDYNDCMDVGIRKCYDDDNTFCLTYKDSDTCYDENKEKYHLAIAFLVLFIFFAIASTIPLYVMCCCTQKPFSVSAPQPYYQPAIGTPQLYTQPAVGMVTLPGKV
eukprot:TRINITY_DN4857_c1_g1_i4.p3 TRINITY_DN4857_c1_g1~~TRINITY_DN4857_c1_g1_i4.p3  ORF type:complete len:145 (-),score=14.36 TRINITY_DN4857_c1_g1_i4:588-1022(-)